jgi:hypothetical protein
MAFLEFDFHRPQSWRMKALDLAYRRLIRHKPVVLHRTQVSFKSTQAVSVIFTQIANVFGSCPRLADGTTAYY